MFNKLKVITKFYLLMLILTVSFSIVVVLSVNYIIKNTAIKRAQTLIIDFVKNQALIHLDGPEAFSLSNPQKTEADFSEVLSNITTSEIFQIKVWDTTGTVIFSDDRTIIGKSDVQDVGFQKAINGEVEVEITESETHASFADRLYSRRAEIMEIYIPIIFNNQLKPSGVIETYYKLDVINSLLWQSQIMVITAVGGITLIFLLLFYIAFDFSIKKPLNRTKNLAVEIARGNMDINLGDLQQNEFGELLQAIDQMRESLKIVMKAYDKNDKFKKT